MKKVFRKEWPDVIFSYTIKNNIFDSRAVAKLGIPLVTSIIVNLYLVPLTL